MFLIRSLIISREVFFVLFSQIEKSPEITGDFSGFRTFLRSSAAFFTASDFTCHLHISCCYIFYALSQKLPEPFLIIDGPDGQINIIFTGHTDKFFCCSEFSSPRMSLSLSHAILHNKDKTISMFYVTAKSLKMQVLCLFIAKIRKSCITVQASNILRGVFVHFVQNSQIYSRQTAVCSSLCASRSVLLLTNRK